MVGAAIGSAVVGALNYGESKKAGRASQRASDQAYGLAEQQWAYQQDMFGQYQDHAMGGIDFVNGMSFGGAGYTAEGYTAEGYDATLVDEGMMAEGNNIAGVAAAQELMDRWNDTFGGLEDNLSEYYNNLDPNKFAIQSKQELQANLDKSMTQFNEQMAASGLQSAGMKQQVAKEAMFAQASGNASIDINADEQVAQMQQGFLNYGEGAKQQASSLLSAATNLDSQLQQNTSVANMQSQNQRDLFNAGAQNSANQFNANANNSAAAFGAQARNSAAAFNAQASNNAARAKSSALMGAYQMQGSSYLQGMNMQDPRIAMKTQEAQNYGASQAGYMGAAGSAFGSAMNLGISAYGGSSGALSGDNGWMY